MPAKRTRKPKRRFPGIRPEWSGGAWKWRMRIMVDGLVRVGTLRDTQEQAADDYAEAARRREHIRNIGEPLTVAQALERVVEDARRRGLEPYSVDCLYESFRRYLERSLGSETLLLDIGVPELVDFIRGALDGGRKPQTIISHDRRLLVAAFKVAGLPCPFDEARAAIGHRLRPIRPRMAFFEPHQVADMLYRLRNDTWPVRQQEPAGRAADVIELLVSTGIRAGELARMRVADIDLERGVIFIPRPKDRTNPRTAEITPNLVPVLHRFIERAEDGRVFPGDSRAVARLLRPWKKRLGFPELSGRALRHSFATGLLYSGSDTGEVKDLMGHRNLSTTDRYVHAVSSRRRAAAGRFAELLQQRSPQPPPSPSASDDENEATSPRRREAPGR